MCLIESVSLIEWVGYISALLTTFSFIPQVLHSWKTRDLSGVSLVMYSVFSLGVLGWLVYGMLIASYPIIIANSVTLVLACIILGLKISARK